ncbi:MAG: TIGR04104 family putative zinc finger protein [Kurthia gibsonii]|uniref:TIGR04104 family putative zinc finger protein n=1 Tax=Kurthia gibsonii TaxID=33946 RepID=A0ABU9LJ63_9BACL
MKNFKQSFQREMYQQKMSEQAKLKIIQKSKKEKRKVLYKPLLLTACLFVLLTSFVLTMFQQQVARVGDAEIGVQSIRIDTKERTAEEGTKLTYSWLSAETELAPSSIQFFQNVLRQATIETKKLEEPEYYYVLEVKSAHQKTEAYKLFTYGNNKYYLENLETNEVFNVGSLYSTSLEVLEIRLSEQETLFILFMLFLSTSLSILFIDRQKKEISKTRERILQVVVGIIMALVVYVFIQTQNMYYVIILAGIAAVVQTMGQYHIQRGSITAMKLLKVALYFLNILIVFMVMSYVSEHEPSSLYAVIMFCLLRFILWLVMKNRKEVTCPHCYEVLDYRTLFKSYWRINKKMRCPHCQQTYVLNKKRMDFQNICMLLVLMLMMTFDGYFGIFATLPTVVSFVYCTYFIIFAPLTIRVHPALKE